MENLKTINDDQANPDKVENIQTIIDQKQKEKTKILSLYGVFFISFMITMVPLTLISIFTFMICICTLAMIYAIRMNAEEDSLLENHMMYLIYTFWRSCLYGVIFLGASVIYLLIFSDYLPLKPCLNFVLNDMGYMLGNGSFHSVGKILKACPALFFERNESTLLISGIIAFGPIFLYLCFRSIQGIIAVIDNRCLDTAKL